MSEMYGVVVTTRRHDGSIWRQGADYVRQEKDVDLLLTWLMWVNHLIDLPPGDRRCWAPASIVSATERDQAETLRGKGWSLDRGMWIFKGDPSCAFTLPAALARQKRADALALEKAKAEALMAVVQAEQNRRLGRHVSPSSNSSAE